MNDVMAIIHKTATASTADLQSDNAHDQLNAKDEIATTAVHQIAYIRDQPTAKDESDIIHTFAKLLLNPTPATPVDADAALSCSPASFDAQCLYSLIDSSKSKCPIAESQLQTLLARQERHLQELSSFNTVKQTMISKSVGSAEVQHIPSQKIELGTFGPVAGDSLNDVLFCVLDLIWSTDIAECVDWPGQALSPSELSDGMPDAVMKPPADPDSKLAVDQQWLLQSGMLDMLGVFDTCDCNTFDGMYDFAKCLGYAEDVCSESDWSHSGLVGDSYECDSSESSECEPSDYYASKYSTYNNYDCDLSRQAAARAR
ncbi:unnamed protein product [Prorocentrum cordatum]|uniref:Uncharacterized protein n=1 Tax=Prorocentrum cordatum TaxID=2364126 RepID=A0ABN9PC33_9DINO|nr:unnamed protein product [Polarella glacialis]